MRWTGSSGHADPPAERAPAEPGTGRLRRRRAVQGQTSSHADLYASAVRVAVLGPPEVIGADGGELRVSAAKERAVLAVLAMRPGVIVRAGELVSFLWGEEPPRTPVKVVRAYVSALRRRLPEGVIETAGGGYRFWIPSDDLDVITFERLVHEGWRAVQEGDSAAVVVCLAGALGLWRGEPLVELPDQSAGIAQRARLVELRLTAQEQLSEALLTLVGDLETTAVAEPLRERRWVQLMLALYRSGRQAEALRAFQRLRTILGSELGLEPSEEVRALEARIVARDPILSDPQAALPSVEAGATRPPRAERSIAASSSFRQRPATVMSW
jgi:DNA-binding SARP family transcriptional activator